MEHENVNGRVTGANVAEVERAVVQFYRIARVAIALLAALAITNLDPSPLHGRLTSRSLLLIFRFVSPIVSRITTVDRTIDETNSALTP